MEVRPPSPPKRNIWEKLKKWLSSFSNHLEDRPPKGDFTNLTRSCPPPQNQPPEVLGAPDEDLPEEEPDSGYEWDGELPGRIDRTPSPPTPKFKPHATPRPFRPAPPPYEGPETTAGVPAHRPSPSK